MATDASPRRDVLLEVSTIGTPSVVRDGQAVTFATRHAACALTWLCVADGARVPAEDMSVALWPTAAESRLAHRLATMTWQIRRALGDAAGLVVRTPDALRVDPSLVTVDLVAARWSARMARAAGKPIDDADVAVLSAAHCTPYADMAWVAALRATNAEILAL